MAQGDTQANTDAHWRATTNLMFKHLGAWLFFGYIVHMFVNVLNNVTIPILQFPLGFYMAAQGSLIIYVVIIFIYARYMNALDRSYGVQEGDDQ